MRAPRPIRKVGVVALVVVWVFIDAIATVLSRNEDPNHTDDAFDPDDPDIVTDFEATADDRIDYRPTGATLERAADSDREYIVHTERRVSIDPDRLEEWVDANYDDQAYVRITTPHGTEVFVRNTPLDYECPVCGAATSMLKISGGSREWIHTGDGRSCTLEEADDDE